MRQSKLYIKSWHLKRREFQHPELFKRLPWRLFFFGFFFGCHDFPSTTNRIRTKNSKRKPHDKKNTPNWYAIMWLDFHPTTKENMKTWIILPFGMLNGWSLKSCGHFEIFKRVGAHWCGILVASRQGSTATHSLTLKKWCLTKKKVVLVWIFPFNSFLWGGI